MDKIWLKQYPPTVPAMVDVEAYPSLVHLIESAFERFADLPACKYMGRSLSYRQLDEASAALGASLQHLGLQRGDRVALMMPNIPQYMVAVAAVLRAGLVVVNVNPLYTPRELAHQLKDAGAKAIVVLENFATTLEQVRAELPLEHIILTGLGDMLAFPRSVVVNYVVRRLKKMVPAFHLPGALRFNALRATGRLRRLTPTSVGPNDVALLQYTGGTTGVSKGAVLLHRQLVANILQSQAWYRPALDRVPSGEQTHIVCALPIYHIFGFNINIMLGMYTGSCNILIPNPRDLPALFKALAPETIHSFPAVNTLFGAILRHPQFGDVDWSHLVLSFGGGMAVQSATAQAWLEKTGCPIIEGYGLSETSPSVAANPVDQNAWTGSIGLPLPNTEVVLLDEDRRPVPVGKPGELAVRGPQVMAGYWQRPEETAQVMTDDGFFLTGDVAVADAQGYLRIVDRKKDMILVSGFNVYPNEIEDVVTRLAGVAECAAVGVPDPKTGEALKLVVVRSNPALTEAEIRKYCEAQLTGYKRPRYVEFREDLPKSTVGKVLRRELR